MLGSNNGTMSANNKIWINWGAINTDKAVKNSRLCGTEDQTDEVVAQGKGQGGIVKRKQ